MISLIDCAHTLLCSINACPHVCDVLSCTASQGQVRSPRQAFDLTGKRQLGCKGELRSKCWLTISTSTAIHGRSLLQQTASQLNTEGSWGSEETLQPAPTFHYRAGRSATPSKTHGLCSASDAEAVATKMLKENNTTVQASRTC